MTKDFVKFLAVVLILYLGFLTTFAMLARDTFTVRHISWILVYVFFGSSYMGFDTATKINPMLGPPLMMIFVALTNILLLTSLISLLSNSLTKILDHAREEYLFQYSLFVLEASASRRLTYYLPPLNLIPLILFRPLRPFVRAETLRQLRITTLKVTHWPFVLLIWAFESAPTPNHWLPWISHKTSIEDVDTNNSNNETNDNMFNPPTHHHQPNGTRTASSRNLNPNSNPVAPNTTSALTPASTPAPAPALTPQKKPSKNWHLDLQPHPHSHGRTSSYGHPAIHNAILLPAANGNGNGNGSSSNKNRNPAPQRHDTESNEYIPSRNDDDNNVAGMSASEVKELKASIVRLEGMVREILAARDSGQDGGQRGGGGGGGGKGDEDDDEG